MKDLEVVKLAHDELESMHWCDGEGKSQEEAGNCMGVSRGTIQRLLASARRKVAHALVGRQALAIAGEADTSPAVPPAREPDGVNMMRRESLR